MASLIPLVIDFSLVVDTDLQPLGKRIDYGCAHAVQAAGYLIASAAELSACMQHGKDHFYRRNAGLVIDSHRDTTTVVDDGDGIILVNRHINIFTEACQGLVH